MLGKGIGIDLGTTSVIIYVTGKGIVLNEPSVVALYTGYEKVVAIGSSASEMVGKNPDSITVIKPMNDGVISDLSITDKMLRYYIQKICGNSIFKPRVVVCMPSTITSLERRTILDAVTAAGAGSACLIEEPLAGAIGAGLDISKPYGTLVVDIGGGTTDVAVITMGSIAISHSVKFAGNKFDQAIIKFVRNKKGIIIGERTAEEIKKKIGCAVPRPVEIAINAKGKDYLSGMPKSFEITSDEVYKALRYPLRKICDGIREVLEDTPPELAADIASQGVLVTGGGALLYGMADMIKKRTGVETVIADDPINCVARGTGIALQDSSILENNGYNFTSRDEIIGLYDEQW